MGGVLVSLQFALMAILGVLALPTFASGAAPPGAWALGIAAVLLVAWAVAHNRPGNFNIRPTPREGGVLVNHGPYRWIRHPMYTAVILGSLACAWTIADSPFGWIATCALAGVLLAKSNLEERLMLAAHPGYAEYRKGTKRFLPGLY